MESCLEKISSSTNWNETTMNASIPYSQRYIQATRGRSWQALSPNSIQFQSQYHPPSSRTHRDTYPQPSGSTYHPYYSLQYLRTPDSSFSGLGQSISRYRTPERADVKHLFGQFLSTLFKMIITKIKGIKVLKMMNMTTKTAKVIWKRIIGRTFIQWWGNEDKYDGDVDADADSDDCAATIMMMMMMTSKISITALLG